MMRRSAGRSIGALIPVAAVLLLAACEATDAPGDGTAVESTEMAAPTAAELAGRPTLPVYFPDQEGTLSPEQRPFAEFGGPEEGARRLAEAVLAGPMDESLIAPLPAGTTLGVSYLTADNHLYLDLTSTEFTQPPVVGSHTEMLVVYSLVDSILLNLPEIEAIVLLWNGRQLPTFAGHIDTSLPLRADPGLVARQ